MNKNLKMLKKLPTKKIQGKRLHTLQSWQHQKRRICQQLLTLTTRNQVQTTQEESTHCLNQALTKTYSKVCLIYTREQSLQDKSEKEILASRVHSLGEIVCTRGKIQKLSNLKAWFKLKIARIYHKPQSRNPVEQAQL